METKKNRKIFNFIMLAVIAVIFAAVIFAVGNTKGWFSASDGQSAVCTDKVGVVTIERNGVSFDLGKNVELKENDILRTKDKAGVRVNYKDNSVFLNENSELMIGSFSEEKMNLTLNGGEIFVTDDKPDKLGTINIQGIEISSDEESVFSVNVQTGSAGVNVFAGKVKAVGNGQSCEAISGQAISIVGTEIAVVDLKIQSLNGFNIEKAMETGKDHKLCFSEDQLQKILDEREAEAEKAAENAEEMEDGDNSSASSASGSGKDKTSSASGSTGSPSGSGNSSSGSGGSSSGSGGGSSASDNRNLSCTIEIRCDTILNNMGNLTPGKEGYVPSNGVILKTTTVKFSQGETVFDVLTRVCSNKGIQIEYSWTPMYGSYYIEGINHLYEFDCGEQSGWMYKVNGWFPNYGCSSYTLEEGDTIVWCYTCNGYGADVGGSVY